MTPEALEVTDGQDRGARFALLPGDSALGRGGQMDVMLTDPSLERLHARLWLDADQLILHDLSGGDTTVNGARLNGGRALAVGDSVLVGDTELTVLWTPGTPPPPVAPPAARVPPAVETPEPPPVDPPSEDEPALDMEVPAAGIALALSLLALVSTWLPFVTRPDGGTASIWTLGPDGLAVQAILVGMLATASAVWWLSGALQGRGPLSRVAPLGVSIFGAAACGLPLFGLAIPIGAGSRDVGLFVLLVAGVGAMAVAAVGVSGTVTDPAGSGPHPGSIVAAAGAGLGGLLAAVSAPLPWLAGNVSEVSGLDPALRAGRLTLPIGFLAAIVAGCALLAPLLGHRRIEFPLVLGAAALGTAGLGLTIATASAFSRFGAEPGLLMTFAGMALAAASGVVGALWMTLSAEDSAQPPEDAVHADDEHVAGEL